MYEQIKDLLQQIKHHKHQHKVTIFNKQKNFLNMKNHNFAQGKLIHSLKTFSYFASLQDNFGVYFLLKLSRFLEPYFLRKNRVLVNVNQNNQLTQYLLCEGIIAVYEINTGQIFEKDENVKKSFKFHKYLSNGSLISFSQFPENKFQISSYSDCKILKLPTKQQLDPTTYHKKITQINQLFSKNPDYSKCRSLFIKCIQKANKAKNVSLDYSLFLSPFDFNQLFMKAKITSYESLTKIYETNQVISSIGLILQGKIVEENILLRSRKITTYYNEIMKLYRMDFKEDPNKVEKNQTLLQESEWIGLQDYLKHLQTKPFRVQNIFKDLCDLEKLEQEAEKQCPRQLIFCTSKQIRTKQYSSILWIPIEYFARKFNYQTNYSIVDQWRSMIQIKNQTRAKNNKIHEKIQSQKKQLQSFTPTLQILPKLPGKLDQLSHNINDLSAKTDIKTKIIFQKQLKYRKTSLKNVKISDTSLLGITMRRDNNLEKSHIIDYEPELKQIKKFSKFCRSTKNKLLEMPKPKIHLETLRKKKSQSQSKIDQNFNFMIDNSPQDLIMYPQAYQPQRLSPDLKSQLFQAQKALRLQEAQYNLPTKQPAMALELSRAQSIERESINQNRMTSIGSNTSLICAAFSSSPEQIYKSLAEKISFKFPNLDQRLRIQKLYKARNKNDQKVTVKERIQTLRFLQEIERKKKIRARNQSIKDQISLSYIPKKNSATHRENFSEQKLQLYM